MPVILAVGPQPHVLGESVQVARARAVRLVAGDGVGDFVQRIESIGPLTHERLDLVDALGLDARRDVDHHQRGGIDLIFADGDQAGPATHRCADEGRTPVAERRDDAFQVLDHHILAVETVGSPVRIAMASRVEGDCMKAGVAKQFTDILPRMACLSAAVLENDEWAAAVAP